MMQLPYFFEPYLPATNDVITVSEDTSRHCVQVLRMREGEKLQLTDGKGNIYTAVIINANKKQCRVRVEKTDYKKQENRKVSVAVSLLKHANRFEWFLEKAVEIGVQEIVPLLCRRTEKQQFKKERLQQIIISAMLQSRQVWLPLLHTPTPFKDALLKTSLHQQKLIAHCVDAAARNEISDMAIPGETQILIGPEGDFTQAEIDLAIEHQYIPVSLGNTRLRTETAGVVASALLIHSPK